MRLTERLKQPDSAFTAWSVASSPEISIRLAGHGYDAVTVDLQHGLHSEVSAFAAVMGIAQRGSPAILRIPVGRNDLASRALDAGYQAVIAPMINTVAEAQAFAKAMKYLPLGERSWGPVQAIVLNPELSAQQYFETANANTLAIAMIETVAAVSAFDEILAVDGIDGVFIGPSDLSISWSGGKAANPDFPGMQEFVAGVVEKARSAGKISAIHATTPKLANRYAGFGYDLIAAGSDEQIIAAGTAALLAEAKRGMAKD